MLSIDYLTGPNTQFPVVYMIPVGLAAWYSGRRPALLLAIAMPLVHVWWLAALWKQVESMPVLMTLTAIRGAVIIAVALWVVRLAEHERELDRHVQALEGLLSICSFCKKIRNESGEWEQLESYVSSRSDARFSHAFCPVCWKANFPELGDPPRDHTTV
jgi:hypothetical protein